ncbi:MAG: rod shape-determining protein MreC [Armatimonadota bacterium]|jgi:rod shape-determining protein MreC
MLSLLREKTVVTLLVLVALGVGIGAVHDHAVEHGRASIVLEAASLILRPSASAFHLTAVAAGAAHDAVRPRRYILKENATLRKEIAKLRAQNAALTEAAQENTRLRAALDLKRSTNLKMISAEIISRKESSWFDTATIGRGRASGIRKGWAVVGSGRWLIGQVLDTDQYSSRIIALTDSNSAIGAMVQRSRCNGILQGQGGDYLTLSYLPKDADVKVGDVIISSGMGQMVPKGFIVGRVVKVVHNKSLGSTTALVRPSIRFDQVEHVFVVQPTQSVPK